MRRTQLARSGPTKPYAKPKATMLRASPRFVPSGRTLPKYLWLRFAAVHASRIAPTVQYITSASRVKKIRLCLTVGFCTTPDHGTPRPFA